MNTNSKQCNACGEIKPFTAFRRNKETQDGYQNRCSVCKDAGIPVNREISKANRKRKYSRTGPRLCRTCGFEKEPNEFPNNYIDSRGYDTIHTKCRSCINWSTRLATYNITDDEFWQLMKDQRGRCAICDTSFLKWTDIRNLHVDHCHTTGVVRGLLCGDCNKGLGMFRDNPFFLQSAIAYLGATG